MLLVTALGACSGVAQNQVWVASSATSDPNFVSYNTTIHGFPQGYSGPEMDVSLNQLYGQFGQEFPSARNWNTNNGFSFAIQNQESFPLSLGFLVKTATGGQMLSIFEVPANQRVQYYIDNSGFSRAGSWMARPLPVFPNSYKHTIVFQNQPLSAVKSWQIYYRGNTPARVRVTDVTGHLVDLNYPNSVDRYGQLSYQAWTGKVFEDLELVQERIREANAIAAQPGGGDLWGARNLPTITATGKWRTFKTPSGKWYIVTPAGKLLWSFGVTSAASNVANATILDGRTSMFQELPATGTDEAAFYGNIVKSGATKSTFNFSGVNLLRKYGSGYATAWQARTADRIKSWGMNTLGSGSDLNVMENYNIPGTLTITTTDYPVKLAAPYALWGYMPDPHHSGFQTWIANRYRAMLQSFSRNGRLMGVFVDGENGWMNPDGTDAGHYQIPLAALRAGKLQPSKQVFLAQLRSKYSTIGALNAAWRTNYPSWSYMYDNSLNLGTSFSTAEIADFSKFFNTFIAKYYACIRGALNDMGLNCMFLGSKDSTGWTPPEVHEQAAKYVDVISVTCYGRANAIDWNYLNSLKKPLMIAEYTFATNERGASASTDWMGDLQFDKTQRAAEAQAYLTQALAGKNIVGAHWFTYQDGVVSGRATDLENFPIGMVDITDRPYDELVSVFRNFAAGMYSQRGY